jgi:hypothetical protein
LMRNSVVDRNRNNNKEENENENENEGNQKYVTSVVGEGVCYSLCSNADKDYQEFYTLTRPITPQKLIFWTRIGVVYR